MRLHIHYYSQMYMRNNYTLYEMCRCGKTREVHVGETTIERINIKL